MRGATAPREGSWRLWWSQPCPHSTPTGHQGRPGGSWRAGWLPGRAGPEPRRRQEAGWLSLKLSPAPVPPARTASCLKSPGALARREHQCPSLTSNLEQEPHSALPAWGLGPLLVPTTCPKVGSPCLSSAPRPSLPLTGRGWWLFPAGASAPGRISKANSSAAGRRACGPGRLPINGEPPPWGHLEMCLRVPDLSWLRDPQDSVAQCPRVGGPVVAPADMPADGDFLGHPACSPPLGPRVPRAARAGGRTVRAAHCSLRHNARLAAAPCGTTQVSDFLSSQPPRAREDLLSPSGGCPFPHPRPMPTASPTQEARPASRSPRSLGWR